MKDSVALQQFCVAQFVIPTFTAVTPSLAIFCGQEIVFCK